MAPFQFLVSLLVLVSATLAVVFLSFRGRETLADVFLSFRGREIRAGFTYHLYVALVEAEIPTFIDDEGIRRGRNIDSEIERAINESKISIILFSEDFPSSTYCLDEVVMIMERRRTVGLHVLPVFYKVSTDEVSKQNGRYVQAFAEHEKQFKGEIHKVEQWRAALSEAAGIAGEVYIDRLPEAIFIKNIVQVVRNELNNIAQVVKKERNDKFWTGASYYYNQFIKLITMVVCLGCGFVFLGLINEYRSIGTAYAFVSTGGRDSEEFASGLTEALILSRVPTYRSRTGRNRWGLFWPNIWNPIKVSRMSIVVFSKDFASSRRCLDELVMIMERKRIDDEYIVIPIFYEVDRLDVRFQTAAYGLAFNRHRNTTEARVVREWRAALEEAAGAANEPAVTSINRFDPPCIQDIADRIRMHRQEH